ncbi:Neuronal tyrosine-phosphorylated phosphoinositide-3-kinase adapter 2 [Merluccius polli]|uniref:Neuronal tyrosine-phosphorylated phosphoinositide-3-kinase adapter 2 n=1 Tax=Merluccius polli TaxID=89951 RepID=A0AA47MVF2_MERPO|nr:Neuronal tyrosine-phosphorylated phosphoinositide-3-kinase adapter 2 [Merluccius polli]
MPPPKPKRNPNTQLSTSFDESYIFCNHGNKKSPLLKDKCSSQSQSPPPASRDTDEEEPVYIEMVGNIKGHEALDDDQSECVYEEMKYPMVDEFMQDSKWDNSCQMGSLSDIPPPFPNLLSHRPPPAGVPPRLLHSAPQTLTSLLSLRWTSPDCPCWNMLESLLRHRRSPPTTAKAKTGKETQSPPSGRSSAPPLASNLYNSAGSSHSGQGYPRSHSACPSPVSMGRCLTPLTLKRPPPYDSLMAGGSMPRSHKSQDGASKLNSSSSANGSLQNVSTRCQTPTSPLEELSSLLNSGRHMINKGSGGRKGREGDGDARSQTRPDSKDRERTGIISSQEWDLQSKSPSSSSHASSRMGRSSVSPTMLLGGVESRTGCKLGRSASTSGVPSSAGAPQRSAPHPALSQMPWICGDATMMEMIEKKRVLCGEIKCRQGAERSLYKQDSMPILPSWKRKQPPPYPYPATNTAVFWDTAI